MSHLKQQSIKTHPVEASRFLFSEDPLTERVGTNRDCRDCRHLVYMVPPRMKTATRRASHTMPNIGHSTARLSAGTS